MVMFSSSAWDVEVPPELSAAERDRAPWLDRLVELHVLAEHGDLAAIDAATRWLGSDAQARRVWDEIDTLCAGVRGRVGAPS